MRKRGFSLIELMIVVAIIGILASIAVPNFVKFQCRAKQMEAKTALKNLVVAQETYRGEYDRYAAGNEASLLITSFVISGTLRRYSIYVSNATGTTYNGFAIATPPRGADLTNGSLQDMWSTTQQGGLDPIVNVCE
jgi:prepilin-type N-terminal cleavage/methylation domain-containing protein